MRTVCGQPIVGAKQVRQFSVPRPHRHAGLHKLRPQAAAGGASTAQEPVADSQSMNSSMPTASASRCPFAHQAGLDSLASASSNMIKLMPLDTSSKAADSDNISSLPLLSGAGWATLAPNEGKDLPAPEGRFCWNPILGEMLELEANGMGPFLLERCKEFGPVFSWQMGSQKVTTILDYDTIKSLLQQDGKVVKGWNPETLYAMLGESTRQNMENPSSRVAVRKLLAPGFSPHALSGYLERMVSIVSTQLDEWVSGGPIDLNSEAKALSFEFSTQLLVNFAVPKEQKQQLRQKFDRLFTAMMAPAINLPGTRFSSGLKARQELIEDVKALLKSSSSSSSSSSDGSGSSSSTGGKTSVFEHMLEANKFLLHTDTLSEDDVAASGISLIIAGNDTSGLGITGLLGLLPLVPGVVHKLRQEQEQLIGTHGPQLSRGVLDSMPYADAVIKEVLRFTPPATAAFRRTLVDMQIGGKFVPAGSIIYLSFFIAQLLTDPHLHPDSQAAAALAQQDRWTQHIPADYFKFISGKTLEAEFKPERWLAPSGQLPGSEQQGPDSQAVAKPSGLLTFGMGPHVCLGHSLFMMEARVLVALLARHYTLQLETPDEFAVKIGFIPQPNQACMLRVAKRD